MTLPRIAPTELEPVVGSPVWLFWPTSYDTFAGPLAGLVTKVNERDEQDNAIVHVTAFDSAGYAQLVRYGPIRLFDRLSDRQREQLCKAEVVAWAEWKPKERGRMPTNQDEPPEPGENSAKKA